MASFRSFPSTLTSMLTSASSLTYVPASAFNSIGEGWAGWTRSYTSAMPFDAGTDNRP